MPFPALYTNSLSLGISVTHVTSFGAPSRPNRLAEAGLPAAHNFHPPPHPGQPLPLKTKASSGFLQDCSGQEEVAEGSQIKGLAQTPLQSPQAQHSRSVEGAAAARAASPRHPAFVPVGLGKTELHQKVGQHDNEKPLVRGAW